VRRQRHLFLPPIELDRGSDSPLYAQLHRQLASAIRRSALDGARLPSTRTLARLLGVSRNTVLMAYDDLVASGLIEGQRGSGMHVAAKRPMAVFDPRRVMREAQYPARTFAFLDQDGTPLYLSY
jgi:GntR family transcriptional regulator/MocR family aminotransferase